MNESVNHGGVCRTAPATPGLLIIFTLRIFNRPGVAGAVLQTPPSFIHSFGQ